MLFRYGRWMRVVERSFSELLRQPNEVIAELADHDVVLRRRNAPALRLSQADRDEQRSEAFEVLARLLRNLAAHQPDALDAAIDEVFPWVAFLTTADRELFVEELTTTLAAATAVENLSPVAQLLREWRNTAEIHADPALARRLHTSVAPLGGQVNAPTT